MENNKNELEIVSKEVVEIELRLQQIKVLEQQQKDLKSQLFELMQQYDIKKWTTTNGVQISRVDGTDETIEDIDVFDLDTFKQEHKDLYDSYVTKTTKINKGKKGYVKITLPKTIDFSKLGE